MQFCISLEQNSKQMYRSFKLVIRKQRLTLNINNKHLLRNNTKDYDWKTQYSTHWQKSGLGYLLFSVVTGSLETSGYTFMSVHRPTIQT